MKFVQFVLILVLLCSIYSATSLLSKKRFSCKNPLLDKILGQMIKEKSIQHLEVQKTFCSVDRNDFLRKNEVYGMVPIYIGHGATLSRADAHVFGLEKAFEKFKGKAIKVLDIGSGSGIM